MLLTALALWLAAASAVPDTVRLQFVGHSGWLITVGDVSVLIDPVGTNAIGRVGTSVAPSVPTDGLDLLIVTHGHSDHYAQAYVRSAAGAGIPVAVGHDIDTVTNATMLAPRQTYTIGDVKLTTIESTDAGVGVVLQIGAFKIYHGGDHALWAEGLREPYQAEIDWLAETVGTVDVVLVAVATGQMCEVRPSLLEGAQYAATRLDARLVIPMHLQCLDRLPGVVDTLRARLGPGGATVVAPRRVGDDLTLPPHMS